MCLNQRREKKKKNKEHVTKKLKTNFFSESRKQAPQFKWVKMEANTSVKDTTTTSSTSKKYQKAKRVIHQLNKENIKLERELGQSNAELQKYVRGFEFLKTALEAMKGSDLTMSKEELLQQMQTDFPSSDSEDYQDGDEDENENENHRPVDIAYTGGGK